MTVLEFSDQFDVLFNNITSNQAPGLNEYEKSVFLTKAQEEIVKNYFNPKSNQKQEGFDDSPKRQVDFSSIIRTSRLLPIDEDVDKFDQRSIAYRMPSDLFISLNEQLTSNNIPITVQPISYREYDRLMSKPYKYPPKYIAWRLITKNVSVPSSPTIASETVADYTLTTKSDYGKPVRVIIETTTEDSVAPSIRETSTMVTITMVIGKTITTDSGTTELTNTSGYWSAYLVDSARRTSATSKYLFPWDGHNSIFPSIPIGDSWESGVAFDLTNAGGELGGTVTIAEIIGKFPDIPIYTMRYIKRPNPIILVSLSDIQNGLTIQGASAAQTSELPEEIHEEILQRAVELAKIAWAGDPAATIQTGQRSE